MGLRGVARLGEQQRHRLLGRADDVGLRSVHDHHPAPRGGIDVDVVESDAGAGHHLEVRGGREHLLGDLGGAADDQRVVRLDLGREVTGGEIGALVHLELAPQAARARAPRAAR